MRNSKTVLLAVTLCLCAASAAHAGWMETEFDLSDSTLWVKQDLGGTPVVIRIPGSDIPEGSGPSGSLAGILRLISPVVGTNVASPTDGSGAVANVDIDISVDFQADFTGPLGLVADITGTSNADSVGWALGTFSDDVAHSPLGALVMSTETHLACGSTSPFINGCEELQAGFPIDRTLTKPTTKSLTFSIQNAATPSAASFTVNLTLDLASLDATMPLFATVQLVGKEVPGSRVITNLVPEPGSLILLASGVLGLAILAARGSA
jgi:hypothetical protein